MIKVTEEQLTELRNLIAYPGKIYSIEEVDIDGKGNITCMFTGGMNPRLVRKFYCFISGTRKGYTLANNLRE